MRHRAGIGITEESDAVAIIVSEQTGRVSLTVKGAIQQDLDAGEAEAIALAVETEAELLLMDERLGRESARHFGLRYVGLIGVLVEAKRKGLVRAVRPYLNELRDIAGFRIRDTLYIRVLRDEGEA